jgi:hypothetical protein
MRTVSAIVVLFSLCFAFAQDSIAIAQSAAPFDGAVGSLSDRTIITYLPGYGLNVNSNYLGDFDANSIRQQLVGIVTGLAGLVHGLADNDFVSVAWNGRGYGGGNVVHFVVRVRPADLTSLEVFENGVRTSP